MKNVPGALTPRSDRIFPRDFFPRWSTHRVLFKNNHSDLLTLSERGEMNKEPGVSRFFLVFFKDRSLMLNQNLFSRKKLFKSKIQNFSELNESWRLIFSGIEVLMSIIEWRNMSPKLLLNFEIQHLLFFAYCRSFTQEMTSIFKAWAQSVI